MEKYYRLLSCLSLMLLLGCQSQENGGENAQKDLGNQTVIVDDFDAIWGRASQYTIELARLMPEEFYSFQPIGEVRTFQEQLIHTIQNIYWLTSTHISQENNPIELGIENLSKVETIRLLEDACKYVTSSIQGKTDSEMEENISLFNSIPVPRSRALYLMRDHMTHHRAQCIIYLRMKGIEPPSYVGW